MQAPWTPEPFHFGSADTDVNVVAFPVQFEPPDPSNPSAPADPGATANNGRWYADIEIDTSSAYFPFLRLALTRYQSYNAGQERNACSEIVLADFVQIAPDRSLTLVFDPTQPLQVNVVVTGPVGASASDSGNSLQAQVEVNQGTGSAPLWMPGETADLVQVPVPGGGVLNLWRRFIALPVSRGIHPMRIVLREYETWTVDGSGRAAGTPPTTAQRLVFVASCNL